VWERQGSRLLAFEGFGLCCLVGLGLWVLGLWAFFGGLGCGYFCYFWACGSSKNSILVHMRS